MKRGEVTHEKDFVGFCVAMLGSMLPLSSLQAAPRTSVSGTGSGATCTRAAPCANFTTALAATGPGGEINVLEPGDFGAIAGAVAAEL